jgi:hypothetical protein
MKRLADRSIGESRDRIGNSEPYQQAFDDHSLRARLRLTCPHWESKQTYDLVMGEVRYWPVADVAEGWRLRPLLTQKRTLYVMPTFELAGYQ